ncbi:MAG: hypothetical protein ACO3QM_00760, partial [Candidatus Nanopelagicaceae bacterium]
MAVSRAPKNAPKKKSAATSAKKSAPKKVAKAALAKKPVKKSAPVEKKGPRRFPTKAELEAMKA